MISKSEIKLINSLTQKKQRFKHELFVAEGIKVIKELLNSDFELNTIFAETDLFFTAPDKVRMVSEKELKQITNLKTPQTALGLFKMPKRDRVEDFTFSVALDGVRDPGNLGTIIRLCDWFGVQNLICSEDTVDCFNPKVVQASMGSIARVKIDYVALPAYLEASRKPIFGTFMNGETIYKTDVSAEGILVLGNEANGISAEIEKLTTQKLSIPQFGNSKSTESLNVATATAIMLSEFKRR